MRENFIVDTCWGGRKDASRANSIDDLAGSRTAICGQADGYVDRLNFDIADLDTTVADGASAACRDAVNCIESATTDILNLLKSTDGFLDADALDEALEGEDMDDIYSDTGDVGFESCFEKSLDDIEETRDECTNTTGSDADCAVPQYASRSGPPECGDFNSQGSLPICPTGIVGMFEDFGPLRIRPPKQVTLP
jgi:hypothetical protein